MRFIRGKRLTALLLALVISLGLAACGGEKDDKKGDTDQLSSTVYVPQFIDIDVELDYINSGCSDGKNVYLVGNVSKETEATDPETGETYTNYEYRDVIYRIPLEGGPAEELENFEMSALPEGSEGNVSIDGLRPGAEGTLWVSERIYTYSFDLPADFDETTGNKWDYHTGSTEVNLQRQLDSTGNEIARVDTSGLKEKLEADYIYATLFDKEGDLYVSVEGKIAVLDPSLNVKFVLEDEQLWGDALTLLNDGSVGVRISYSDPATETYGYKTVKIDKEAKGWGDEYILPQNAYQIYSGGGDFLFYYQNGDALYGFREETGEGERLLSWLDANINVNDISFFSFLEDGRVVVMTNSYQSGSFSYELAVLTATDRASLPEKTTLTYATMGLNYNMRNSIIDFNKTNSLYRIEVKDYSEFATAEDASAGLTRLNTEIVAGNVPDMLDTSGLPLSQYGAKGLLEDLWPYIENDTDIGGRAGLMERVFNAAEQDGKLYQVFDSFSINTVVGSRKVVGDELGWTLDELQAALATMPEGCTIFGEGDTKSGMLRSILALNLDAYVDWSTGVCSFDSDAFRKALEFCNSFPLEYDWESVDWEDQEDAYTLISNGRQMLMTYNLSSFEDMQMYEAMFGGSEALNSFSMEYSYGSDGAYSVIVGPGGGSAGLDSGMDSSRLIPGRYITFKGYPMEDGSCGSSFVINSGIAMSSSCKDKEGAWTFMRELLLPKVTDTEDGYRSSRYNFFPTNKSDFEKVAQECMKAEYVKDSEGNNVLDPNGNPIQESKGGWGWGSLNIDIQATSQEEYDQVMELYNAVDSLYTYDTSIYDIVNDAAGGYFSGDRSLDDTVAQIQSRVNLYVNENR